MIDLGESFADPRSRIGGPVRVGILVLAKMFEATFAAANKNPESSAWMEANRSEWKSTTGEIFPETVAEFTRQALLAGIDPNKLLDEQGICVDQLNLLLPLIFAGLERLHRQSPKTALITTPDVRKPTNKRNNSEKHSLMDDDNTLCLAAARDEGSDFTRAAAFVRDYRGKRKECKATQKALEQMLSRQCNIWKKQR